MRDEAKGFGLVDRMARTWASPRRAARCEIDAADEARLLFYAVAASALGTLGVIGAQSLNPSPDAAAEFERWATTQIVAGLFVRPLGLYAAAGLIGLACRSAGGRGDWRATRAATFWTALVAAPVGAVLAVAAAAAAAYGLAPQGAAAAGQAAGSALWGLLLAPALAEAHGFRSSAPILAAFLSLALLAGLAAGLA